MCRYLKDEWKAKVGEGEFDGSEWTDFNDNANTPTQDNSYDCGVFTSQFMRCLSMRGKLLQLLCFFICLYSWVCFVCVVVPLEPTVRTCFFSDA